MGKAPGTFASSLDCEVYHPLESPCSAACLCIVSLLRNGRSVASQTTSIFTSFLAAQQMSNEWVSMFIHTLFRHNQQQKSAHTSEKLSVITGINTRPLQWEGEGKKWCRTRRSIYITWCMIPHVHRHFHYSTPPAVFSKLFFQQSQSESLLLSQSVGTVLG